MIGNASSDGNRELSACRINRPGFNVHDVLDGTMSTTVTPLPAPDDRLAATVEKSLRLRVRTFMVLVAAAGALTLANLFLPGTVWSEAAGTLSSWLIGLGIPWLGWHLRIPFAGRLIALLVQCAGFSLHGADPRGELWSLGALPLQYFLIGWVADLCLRQEGPWKVWVGRAAFTLLWLYVLDTIIGTDWGNPKLWSNVIAMLAGIATVWMPRGNLLPKGWRATGVVGEIIQESLGSAGSWLASRAAIALLLILPSLVYLDLLDLPPRLAEEAASAKDTLPGGTAFFFWTREGRAITSENFQKIEVYAAAPGATREVVQTILALRDNPTDPEARSSLAALGTKRLEIVLDLFAGLDTSTIFYIDPAGSGDDRVSAGVWLTPDEKWKRHAELRLLPIDQDEKSASAVARATIVILAGGIMILLLLGGPSGGSRAAWWLAIFLAGTHVGWVSESLDLVVDRVRYVIWRDHSSLPLVGTLFSLHTLLIGCMRLAEWMVSQLLAHAGLWVALCWPARPGPLIRTWRDRFCLQAAKIVLIWALLYILRLFFFLCGTKMEQSWYFHAWFITLPMLLVIGGWAFRKRRSPDVKLPRIGELAAGAIFVRLLVPLFNSLGTSWGPNLAVALTVVAAIALIIALERGSFLNPPHVEGHLWIIGVAAIPFIENVIGDPVSTFLEGSDLFLGSTVGWLAFAASLWVIGPITEFFSDKLSRWRAKGLDRIEIFSGHVIEASRDGRSPALIASRFEELLGRLGIENGQLWRYRGAGIFDRVVPSADGVSYDLISESLAEALAGATGSLRLEEMRLEWRWAPYHRELERWFREGGDLIIVPAAYEGHLLGVFACTDVEANRFLLRPAVGTGLSAALAAALLQLDPPPSSGGSERT